jgi:hypothetical protein
MRAGPGLFASLLAVTGLASTSRLLPPQVGHGSPTGVSSRFASQSGQYIIFGASPSSFAEITHDYATDACGDPITENRVQLLSRE